MKALKRNFCSFALVMLNLAVLRPVVSLVPETNLTVMRDAWGGVAPSRDQIRKITSSTAPRQRTAHRILERFPVGDGVLIEREAANDKSSAMAAARRAACNRSVAPPFAAVNG